jgi:hypothetical protein
VTGSSGPTLVSAPDPYAPPGTGEAPPPSTPPPPSKAPPAGRIAGLLDKARAYVLGYDPTFWWALVPFALLCVVLYTRNPATTNYIFDEQEALLANPYVNATGGLRFIDAIHRDFWGLPPDRSVGSYRPLPNFLWRSLWHISHQPFFHHIYNVFFHAANGALLTLLAFRLTRRRGLAWLAGVLFVSAAVLTEAVSGIVGIADVLGGMGAILALLALCLPAWGMPLGVFAACLFGLFSKESAVVCVPLVPFAALVAAPLTHPERPARVLRALGAFIGAAAAFVLYVELRRRWFPSPTPSELTVPLPENASQLQQAARAFLLWFHQAPLPKDRLNNPLVDADLPHRVSGALRVYLRGLGQVVFPRTLSGDYSFPQEPIPDRVYNAESVAGGLLMLGPPFLALAGWVYAMGRERKARALAILQRTSPVAARRVPMLAAGALLLLLAAAAPVVDFFFLRPRGVTFLVRGFPWSLLVAPLLGATGLGLVCEGLRGNVAPDPDRAPRPLDRAGIPLVAIGLVWMVVSYFPHSNIPVVLPTVRAERFWYFPVIGTSLVLAVAYTALHRVLRPRQGVPWMVPALFGAFFAFQCVKAYLHAMDYRSDLTFWEATKNAVPLSAKAHLNYSVMKGARGDMNTRLAESRIAMQLAPEWPMAHVYTGDTLCRMHRAEEAWPHYEVGFDKGPNELGLLALGLQCLYDEKQLVAHEDALREMAEKHPGTWLAYLAVDTLDNAEKHHGVDPKYRPRSYNEGPKDEQ